MQCTVAPHWPAFREGLHDDCGDVGCFLLAEQFGSGPGKVAVWGCPQHGDSAVVMAALACGDQWLVCGLHVGLELNELAHGVVDPRDDGARAAEIG